MTIASDLTRIKNAKQSIKAAIGEKGVEVPDTELISTYSTYIDQITTGGPTPPTGDGTLTDLKKALDYGNAAELYPAGTEIPDTYAGNSNPLIVAQYLDSTNNFAYGGVEGAILIRKFVEPTSQQFGGSVDYASSAIKNFLDTTYLDNCSEALKSVIAEVNIPYNYTTVKSKLFLMSAYEVCNIGNGTYEGVMWDYWKQKTGLSAPNAMYTNNNGRIMKDRNGTAQSVWLRSRYSSSLVCYVTTTGSVSSTDSPSNTRGVLPACFIAKD